MMRYGWEGGPIVSYGGPAGEVGTAGEMDGATFSRTCPACGRMVTADAEVQLDGRGQPVGDNATCFKCGRISMPFIGYP